MTVQAGYRVGSDAIRAGRPVILHDDLRVRAWRAARAMSSRASSARRSASRSPLGGQRCLVALRGFAGASLLVVGGRCRPISVPRAGERARRGTRRRAGPPARRHPAAGSGNAPRGRPRRPTGASRRCWPTGAADGGPPRAALVRRPLPRRAAPPPSRPPPGRRAPRSRRRARHPPRVGAARARSGGSRIHGAAVEKYEPATSLRKRPRRGASCGGDVCRAARSPHVSLPRSSRFELQTAAED